MLQLNYRDSRPIYEQVRDGLRQMLMTGGILSGEKLPSVRALATQLTINPNTIQRAYEALEQEGYVYSVVGRGTFAAERSDIKEQRREDLFRTFETVAKELLFLGETPETLLVHLRNWEGKTHDSNS